MVSTPNYIKVPSSTKKKKAKKPTLQKRAAFPLCPVKVMKYVSYIRVQ